MREYRCGWKTTSEPARLAHQLGRRSTTTADDLAGVVRVVVDDGDAAGRALGLEAPSGAGEPEQPVEHAGRVLPEALDGAGVGRRGVEQVVPSGDVDAQRAVLAVRTGHGDPAHQAARHLVAQDDVGLG